MLVVLTQGAGIEVVPLPQAIARDRAAADMKKELDPDFVVTARCYARDAANGGLKDRLHAPGDLGRAVGFSPGVPDAVNHVAGLTW